MTKEHEYLLGMLKGYAIEINKACAEYHATVDISGTTPQLLVS